ncbi:hypothetical protein SBADM41S_06351 [Streptomyces badius]
MRLRKRQMDVHRLVEPECTVDSRHFGFGGPLAQDR